MKGLVAFSFGLGKNEPNRCNRRLAGAVRFIVAGERESVLVISQWEITKALKSIPIAYVVKKHRIRGRYLDSEEVMAQAAKILRKHRITEVIPVANPFLHLIKCRALVRKEGFEPLKREIGWIGFYPESIQWWTRGPFRFLLYVILQILTGWRGK